MKIREVIEWLEDYRKEHPTVSTIYGWKRGGCFAGFYDEFAVEPAHEIVSIDTMIDVLREAIGKTFIDCVDEEHIMCPETDVYYAYFGCSGPKITKSLLRSIFEDDSFDHTEFE